MSSTMSTTAVEIVSLDRAQVALILEAISTAHEIAADEVAYAQTGGDINYFAATVQRFADLDTLLMGLLSLPIPMDAEELSISVGLDSEPEDMWGYYDDEPYRDWSRDF